MRRVVALALAAAAICPGRAASIHTERAPIVLAQIEVWGLAIIRAPWPAPTPTPTPSPAPTPTPTPSPPPAAEDAIVALLRAGPWPLEEAIAVVECESRFDPRARNGAHYGLFQIAYPTHRSKLVRVAGRGDPELLLDPYVNIAVAALIYTESGGGTWLPWSCRP